MSNKRILTIEVEVKDWENDNVETGDYIEYKNQVYQFEGYEYGRYPIAKHIETSAQIELPSK